MAVDTYTKILSQYWTSETSRLRKKERDGARSARGGLAEAALRTVHSVLSEDGDLNLWTILNGVNPPVLHRLLFKDGMLPYSIYRTYRRLLERSLVPDIEAAATGVSPSINETVMKNDEYLRKLTQPDDMYLLNCKGLANLILKEGLSQVAPSRAGDFIKFKRKCFSPGDPPILPELLRPEIFIRSSDESCCEAFETRFGGTLQGLDWANVMMIGPAVLETLLVPSISSTAPGYPASKIELVLYGLDSETADAKLQHIYDVWMNNLNGVKGRVQRGPHGISLLPLVDSLTVGGESTVNIFTKIYRSKCDGLLDIARDTLAIAFDGSGVLMLPRCARAIEIGRDHTNWVLQRIGSADEYAIMTSRWEKTNIFQSSAIFRSSNQTPFHEYIWPFVSARTGIFAQQSDFLNYLTGRVTMWCENTDLLEALGRSLKWPLWLTKELEDMMADLLPAGALIPAYNVRAHAAGSNYQGILPPLPEDRSSDGVGNLRYLVFKRSYWRGLHMEQDRAMDFLLMISNIQLRTEVCRFQNLEVAQRRFSEAMQRAIEKGRLSRF